MSTITQVQLSVPLSASSASGGGTAVEQLQQLLAQYQALFAQWEQDKISGIDMTKINAQIEACMTQIEQFLSCPENTQQLMAALKAEGWSPTGNYGLNFNPFALLNAVMALAKDFLESPTEWTLSSFNEFLDTLVNDLTNKAPPPSLQTSLPEQAINILVEMEAILESPGTLTLAKLEKLETLGARLGHMFHWVNQGPNSKENAAAYNLFMNTLSELIREQKNPLSPPSSEANTLMAAFSALLQGLMM